MKDANHFNTVCERQIEDDVLADDKTPQIWIKLRSSATQSRSSRQECESFVDSCREVVSVCQAILGNVRPDFGEIRKCARAFENDRHLFMSVVRCVTYPAQPIAYDPRASSLQHPMKLPGRFPIPRECPGADAP